ncbi:MAG TPA: hypothetical protein VFO10_07490 [Oligoflexus sp.]|uniref:hypothetical protein n=1 Tax=Oligoflexus sp. TaxID=1971216 RepID=UPI002D810E28|nr:hypothetical protein [Oligoflexus sp.]HET9237076.1 hypothetical protein [Oligoflexus sp.]
MLSKGSLFAKEVNEFGTRSLFKDSDVRAVFPKTQETWMYEGDKFQKVSTSYCTEMKFPEMVPAKRTMTKFMNDVPVQTTLSFMHVDASKVATKGLADWTIIVAFAVKYGKSYRRYHGPKALRTVI